MKRLVDMTDPEICKYLQHLAAATESVMPAGPSAQGRALFVLLVFDEPRLVQYVSNGERGQMIKALREAADRLEHNHDLKREPDQ